MPYALFDGKNDGFDAMWFVIGCVLLFDPSEINRETAVSTMLIHIAKYINFDVSDALR